MKAWRIYGAGDMRLDEVPDPKVKPGWVMVKVKVVQPSVTEVVEFMGGAPAESAIFTRFLKERAPLQLFGHEFSGEVVEVGEGVTSLKIGSRVVPWEVRVACEECAACKAGRRELCRNSHVIGDESVPGCFAEYAVLPAYDLVEVPDAINDNEAACIQPLTACVRTVEVAQIELGDTAVVLGQGAMGLGVMQIARVSGAGKIITTDINELNIKLSKELGADDVINAKETPPVEAIRELTQGLGADIVFEAAGGRPEEGLSGFDTLYQALRIVRYGGKVVQVAIYGKPLVFPPALFLRRGIRYLSIGPFSKKIIDHLVHLLATHRIKAEPTITHRLKGLEAVPQAFEITGNKAKYNAVNPAQVVVST